jgi:GH18 family chitinase
VAYTAGMQVSYGGAIYQCLQPNTSQTGWDPVSAPALWTLLGSCSSPSASATASPTGTLRAGSPAPSGTATPAYSATASPTVTSIYSPTRTTTFTVSPTRSPSPLPSPTPGNKRFVGYFAQWGVYARNFFVKNVDTTGEASKLTHIIYAFANIQNNLPVVGVSQTGVGDAYADYQMGYTTANSVDGVADVWNQPLKGNWNQLKKLKAKYPNLKVLMALGGWSWSDGFYTAAQPANRVAFVAACIDAFINGNIPYDAGSSSGGPGAAAGVFDGIDIDWEYPGSCGNDPGCTASPADMANFTGLLAEFRKQLDAVRPGLQLVAAVPAGSDKMGAFDIPGIAANVDFVDLMSYDFFGAWAATGPTALQSALYAWPGMPTSGAQGNYYSDYAVQAWKSGGMPAAKMDLGIPYYGRGWTGVPPANNGLNQGATGAAPCSGFTGCTDGITDYKVLQALGAPKFYAAGTAWTYNGSQFWSFDDATTAATKTCYINAQGLGGALVWSLDGDDGSLSAAVATGLQGGACAPTPTPAGSPTASPTNTPVYSPTASPTATRSNTPAPSATRSPSFTASPAPTLTGTPAPTATPGAGPPRHVVIGYWHDFNNGTAYFPLRQVASAWDVVDVAFADTAADYATVSFAPDPGLYASNADFIADVAALHSAGKKVVLSIGGQNGTVTLANATAAQAFVNSVESVVSTYGFDGLDLDIENGFSLAGGDTDFRNPTTPSIVNLINAVKGICAHFGPGFILSMAPQVPNVQGGITAYSGIWGSYLPLIYGLSSQLSYLQIQYYNNGSNTALDGRNYSNGTADFTVAMTDMMLKGFPIAGNASNVFPPLAQAQMVVGVPAAAAAAPSGGYISPSPDLVNAFNELAKGQTFGGAYVLQGGPYPNLGGVMTWSINWDVYTGSTWSGVMAPYIHGLP